MALIPRLKQAERSELSAASQAGPESAFSRSSSNRNVLLRPLHVAREPFRVGPRASGLVRLERLALGLGPGRAQRVPEADDRRLVPQQPAAQVLGHLHLDGVREA